MLELKRRPGFCEGMILSTCNRVEIALTCEDGPASGVAVDDRATSVEGRMKHGGETMREVKKHLAEMTTEEVVDRMIAHEVPCAPVVALEL